MYTLDKIKKHIAKKINDVLGSRLVRASDLVYPPNAEMGDLSLVCFEAAGKLGRPAVEAADRLVSGIRVESPIAGIKATGPYVNFVLDKTALAEDVLKKISRTGAGYGTNKVGEERRVMIEYSNANTHKEYHIGHLRNICYGDAVNRILAANGYKSIPVSYINDFGIHVAKTLWAFQEFYKGKEPKKDHGHFLGTVYARSVKETENDPLAKNKVTFIMRKIESRSGYEYELWQKTRQWSIDNFTRIYDELKVKFDHIFYESEYIEAGMQTVEKFYKKGILKKSQGAIIADLEEYSLGVLIFLRSDGTAMYAVADLPLAIEKLKRYKLDTSVYITDIRQNLHFKQLFKVLELAGVKKGELVHLGYEFVKLPEGMLSSRTGMIITYRDLREQVSNRAEEETRSRHKDWNSEKITEVADVLTNGALKFEMIKVGAGQVITFDINQALRFEGFTAAYLQYTYARIRSIIKKAENSAPGTRHPVLKNLTDPKEYILVMKLARYPEAVVRAGENYDPSEIAKYLFELAQAFNDYYHSVPVLKADKRIRDARLSLCISVSQVIANGLGLLGIDAVEEM